MPIPGLHIYISNRMEILAELLAQILRTPLPSPLTPETIVVQSRGMERWIAMELAGLNGISANCSFPFPNILLDRIFKQIKPDVPVKSLFDPAILTFRLMRIIPHCQNDPGFETLATYLADDDSQLKRFQLARKIADLFDQYLVFRPELILQWEQEKEDKKLPYLWQARLWRRLVAETDRWHRTRLRNVLFRQINHGSLKTEKLPARISIFGISYLPLFHLQTFAALSRLMEVNFFLVDPCREYWADIVSEQEIKKIRRKHPAVAENIEWYHFEKGNRLLASMGTLGRDFFNLITDFDCDIHEHFEAPVSGSVLAGIQSDVLNLRDTKPTDAAVFDRSAAGPPQTSGVDTGNLNFFENDGSLQVHVCHSPMREIEVLHDHLLALLEEDHELLPKDILVMTPDIDRYAPYIQAVFAAQTDDYLRLPFGIADQSPRRENRVIAGFLALLDIPESRFGAAQVLGLLEYSAIKAKFGLVESDLKIIEGWIGDTRIRWGIDSSSRLAAGLPGYPQNTWRAGLDRLILGYAMPGENQTMFNEILPYDHIEGSQARILGRFLAFMDRLFGWANTALQPRGLPKWRRILLNLIDQFLLPDDSSDRDLLILRQALGEMAANAIQANFEDKIKLDVVCSYLKPLLEQNRYGSGFLTGGVTFCAMLPMRSIPFKIICLIGMHNDAFPRDDQPLNFDLMAKYPRAGDRSRRNDDKYLFLESIISARRKLYISYVGQSIQDNSPIPPSVLVSELLDAVEQRFAVVHPNILDQIVTYHRLQPFSAEYFREGTGLFSYSTDNLQAGIAVDPDGQPQPFFAAQLPLTSEEREKWKILDLDALCLFFNNPAKFLLQRRLGLNLTDAPYLTEERENLKLPALEQYLVEQSLIKHLLAGLSPEAAKPFQIATGQLPHGNLGEYYHAEMSIEAKNFVRLIEKFTRPVLREAVEFDLPIAGVQLIDRLAAAYELGCVHIRYAPRRVKDLLNAWIYHLAYCHAAPADYIKKSYLICKGGGLEFQPVADPVPIMTSLLEIFRRGLIEPIRFFPQASFEYARQLLENSMSEKTAFSRAEKKWLGSEFSKYIGAESRDPYVHLCFRQLDPLDEEFKNIALTVFEPLLNHQKEIFTTNPKL